VKQLTTAVCKKCNSIEEDLATAMLNGCTKCGSKLFTVTSKLDEVELESIEEIKTTGSKEVAIKVEGSGKYNINLEKLLASDTKNEPLLIEDKDGVIRLLFKHDD
jgi:predicted  nucleic acid-binding Zn-ribbon protein